MGGAIQSSSLLIGYTLRVSSYAEVYIHGVEIFSWRNEIDPTFLFLFTGGEVRRWLEGADEEKNYGPRERGQLVATAAVLRDRLGTADCYRLPFYDDTSFVTDAPGGQLSPPIPLDGMATTVDGLWAC
jgi:hypothetical protein